VGGSGGGHLEEQIRAFGLGDEGVAAWEATELGDDAFVDWLTDRVARRPTGSRARQVYGAEDVHDFARRAILDSLEPGRDDHLLEIGCGGGLLLRDATAAGAHATGIDHSTDMASLARERAPDARVAIARAEALPFAAARLDAIAMSVVFFFFDRPDEVLAECGRVLRPEGRLAVYTTGPELRGTPAAPEPLASRGHFHTDEELGGLAHAAGFADVTVANDRGGQLLTARWNAGR
jgi:SAM-dependent methyltransferase